MGGGGGGLLSKLYKFRETLCHDRAKKTIDFHTECPQVESWPGSSALGQGTIYPEIPSLLEETLSHRSCV